jgi:hypothetical protein
LIPIRSGDSDVGSEASSLIIAVVAPNSKCDSTDNQESSPLAKDPIDPSQKRKKIPYLNQDPDPDPE